MKHVNTLTDLLVYNLREVYDGEKQQQKSLDTLAVDVANDELQEIIATHRDVTKVRIKRLESIFDELGEDAKTNDCDVMDELLDHVEKIAEKATDDNVRDASIIMGLQCVSHYKIATYGTLATFAKTLGQVKAAELLHTFVEEEKAVDLQLTNLAQKTINMNANTNVLPSM